MLGIKKNRESSLYGESWQFYFCACVVNEIKLAKISTVTIMLFLLALFFGTFISNIFVWKTNAYWSRFVQDSLI